MSCERVTRKGTSSLAEQIAVISDPRPQLPDSDDEFTTTDLLYASRDYDDEDASDVCSHAQTRRGAPGEEWSES